MILHDLVLGALAIGLAAAVTCAIDKFSGWVAGKIIPE